MSNKPVIVKKSFYASASAIWEALTNNEELKRWYFQLEDFKPEVGFKFSFTGGADESVQYLHLCEVTEVIPGKKLVYSWRYDGLEGNSLVTWELEEDGENTLVTITHTGLETMAANGPDFARASFTGGWTYFLEEALARYLANEK